MEANRWRKSTFTQGANNCVEVAHTRQLIRDSKAPALELTVSESAFTALVAVARKGAPSA